MLTTYLFILGTICLIAGFDLLTIRNDGIESSISRVVHRWGVELTVVKYAFAFAMGGLFGHFFL